MQIRVTVPKRDVNETTLGAAAEANAAVAQTQIESGRVPLAADAIRAGLVVWKPEDNAPGQESFDPPSVALERGNADCDDLAPWHAASLRATGEDPEAYPIAYQSGPTRWHVVVQRSDGSIDDPSRWAGMGRVEGNRPATTPPMTTKRGNAVMGFTRKPSGVWVARLDAPMVNVDGDVCGVAVERAAYDQFTALHRLCSALGVLAFWGLPDDVLERMHACARAIRGEPDDYSAYGEFVEGVAKQVAHMSVDPNAAANIATTVLDPFGLHNLIQPLASEFVSSYAQGLAQRGAPSTTQPAVSGDGCPPGSHWELHAGSWVCVPDAYGGVMGDDRVWVTLKATGEKIQVPKDQVASLRAADLIEGAGSSRGGGGRGASGRGGSSRGSGGRGGSSRGGGGRGSRQQQQPQDDGSGDYCDPMTGLCFDASSGLWYDPSTGIPVYGFSPQMPQQFPQYGGQFGYGYGAYPGYGQQPYGAYQGYGAQPSYGMQDPTGYWAQLAAAEQGGGMFAPGAYQYAQPYTYGQPYGYGW